MGEDLTDLFKTLLALTGISTLAAASRSILSEDRRSIGGFLRGFVLAVFVGVIVGMGIQDYELSHATQGAIVGICSFVADDILMLVISVASNVAKNPKLILDIILRKK